MKKLDYRLGNGFDVHRFADSDGDSIFMAGVKIPHTHALEAHSDGDVLIHAVCDAMLGALALGDIGKHFPDTDERYRGIASSELLQHVYELVKNENYIIGNIDVTILAQAPKMQPHVTSMQTSLSKLY